MQRLEPDVADEALLDDGGESAVTTFAARVMGAFLTLVVLFALVVAMVALAYWSKHDLNRSPSQTPGARAQSVQSP